MVLRLVYALSSFVQKIEARLRNCVCEVNEHVTRNLL